MKKLLFTLLVILLCSLIYAQVEPDWLWANNAGYSYSDQAFGVAIDNNGNTYITGTYSAYASFGTIMLGAISGFDIFVAKLDSTGTWLWAKSAGSINVDCGYGISVDDSGNCYITGSCSNATYFGSTTLNCTGLVDIFVAKLDTNGNWLWAKRAGGSGLNRGQGIATDSAGNSYVTGYFGGSGSFGSIPLTSSGDADAFVAKLDTNGNWLWANLAGGAGSDYGCGITCDENGNCYATGNFTGIATFGTTTFTSNGSADIYIAKLDSNGNWLWANLAGGIGGDYGCGIATDNGGNCYATGVFTNSAAFGTTTLTETGNGDIFATKLDTTGNWLWAYRAGGTGYECGNSISTNSNGSCYITGLFEGACSFGNTTLTSAGYTDIFIAELLNDGNWLWAFRAGANGTDKGQSIFTDNNRNTYISGSFTNTATFGNTSITSTSQSVDIFVAKFHNPELVNDLSALSILGSTTPGLGTPSDYVISVKNLGNVASSDYIVKLMMEGDIELDSVLGIAIEPQDSLDFTLSWTPDISGSANIYGKVVSSSDEDSLNDCTANLNVVVQSEGTVTGNVVDNLNNPLPGVTVTCGTESAITDSTGVYNIQISPGVYDVIASYQGFIPATQSGIEILIAQTTIVNFQMSVTINGNANYPVIRTALYGNFPNPFNPESTIRYSLKTACPVSITIYNSKGMLVKTLVDEINHKGFHEIVWRGDDSYQHKVASGIYYYKMISGNYTETRKLVLLK